MQFHVVGDLAEGLVRLEMIRDPAGSNKFEYRLLTLEAPPRSGHRTVLIDTNPRPVKKSASNLFWGIKWGKKKEDDDHEKK